MQGYISRILGRALGVTLSAQVSSGSMMCTCSPAHAPCTLGSTMPLHCQASPAARMTAASHILVSDSRDHH